MEGVVWVMTLPNKLYCDHLTEVLIEVHRQ